MNTTVYGASRHAESAGVRASGRSLDETLVVGVAILALTSGFFFSVRFGSVFGLSLTVLTLSDVLILTAGSYLLLKGQPKLFFTLWTVVTLYMIVGINNEKAVTYGLMFAANAMVPVMLSSYRLPPRTLQRIGYAGLIVGLGVFFLYLVDVKNNGPTVLMNPTLWDEQGYLFRVTTGSVFAFQGWSVNPNAAFFPFLVSYLMVCTGRANAYVIASSVALLIVIAVATNSRGNILLLATVVLFQGARLFWHVSGLRKTLLVGGIVLASVPAASILGTELDILGLGDIGNKFERSTDDLRKEKADLALSIYSEHSVLGGGFDIMGSKHKFTAENGYVEFLATFGTLGLLLLMLAALRVDWRSIRSTPNNALFLVSYLLVNVFNTMYMHPVASLSLGLSFSSPVRVR
jgi:hypothetical protein